MSLTFRGYFQTISVKMACSKRSWCHYVTVESKLRLQIYLHYAGLYINIYTQFANSSFWIFLLNDSLLFYNLNLELQLNYRTDMARCTISYFVTLAAQLIFSPYQFCCYRWARLSIFFCTVLYYVAALLNTSKSLCL